MNSANVAEKHAHVSTERDLVVRQPALGVRVSKRAHAVDDEAVVLDRRLEALQAVPCMKAESPVTGHI